MKRLVTLELAALVMLAGSAANAGTSSTGTYDAAPGVLAAIRQNYQSVTALVTQGKLLQIRRDFGCQGVLDSLRVIWKDGQGVIRRYTVQGGGSDSAMTVSQYYGPDGRLSFALVQAGAVNGTEIETRLYYGPAGNLLRQDERTVHGPGYPFGPVVERIVAFPDVAFTAPAPC
ncbi:hypothetical protein [Deinococcus sp.]|uniref:hypothetical protein n=1 Tax=Deinococcus sp. TaxID=47478 RepID=UPI003C7A8681